MKKKKKIQDRSTQWYVKMNQASLELLVEGSTIPQKRGGI